MSAISSSVGSLDEHGRFDFVEAQAGVVELPVKDVEVPVLERVNDVQDHVCASNHVEDFTASAFAFGGPFDETGQVENLDFRTAMLHHAGNAGQGGERVATGFGVCVGHLGDEGGFTNGRKPDQCNGGVAGLSDLKPFAAAAGF